LRFGPRSHGGNALAPVFQDLTETAAAESRFKRRRPLTWMAPDQGPPPHPLRPRKPADRPARSRRKTQHSARSFKVRERPLEIMASNEAPGRAFCRSLDPPAIEAYTQSQGLAPFEIFLRIVSRQAQFHGATAPQLGRNFSNPLIRARGRSRYSGLRPRPLSMRPPQVYPYLCRKVSIKTRWLSQIESHAPIDPL